MQAKDKMTIHIISHNHWDREWIFTARYANRWLIPFFKNLIKRLQEQPSYRFVLDGQTLIIEDYLNQLSYDEAKTRERQLKKFVREGRLLIGPAYLQPDWSLVSGEALVRNLLIGCQMAEAFGGVMKVGWMLDNFGQIAQAPQIYEGFGIEGAFVWRGIEMDPEQLKTEFIWEAPNKSKILGVYLLNSYRNAMVLSLTRDIARERILSQAEALRPFAATPNVLLMNGYEQVPWPDDVLPIIEEVNQTIEPDMHCIQSTPPDYLEAVKSYNPDLPTLSGYFYSGKYAPILKGVYSSRSHLNLLNNECQRELERWAEPFSSFAWVFGGEYPQHKFLNAWKILLLNHTHDDICGCCVDTIARDMEERFATVFNMASEISNESLRTIAQTVDTSITEGAPALIVFNPSSRPRSELVGYSIDLSQFPSQKFSILDGNNQLIPYQVVKREARKIELYFWAENVPPIGYKAFFFREGNKAFQLRHQVTADARENTMENEAIRVKINPDGTLNLTLKSNGQVYENLGYFEDGGDAGDTYDYSYPENDELMTSLGKKAKVEMQLAGPLLARFKITLNLKLPASLSADRKKRRAEKLHYPIIMFVELAAGSKHVVIRTILDNVAKDHRLRVLFPTPLHTPHSFAEEPFDIATFTDVPEPEPQKVPEKLKNLMLAGRYTAPVNSHPFQNFVGIEDQGNGLAIISRRLTEYEILDGSTIALTLLRAVGWLARYDLLTRVGDVGPHIFTPEAQCLGPHVFSYAIYPYSGTWEQARPHFEADIHNLKMRAVQTNSHEGKLPDEFSLLGWIEEDPPGALRMTALKRAEMGDEVIFRFYNPLTKPVKAKLRHWGKVTQAYGTNLKEEVIRDFFIENDRIHVEVRPKEILSLKLKFEPIAMVSEPTNEDTKRCPLLLPKYKFPKIKYPPVLTRQEVLAEKKRSKMLAQKLQQMRTKAFVLEDEIERTATRDVAKLARLQKIKGEVATLTRQLYECRISLLLNQQLYIIKTIENELEEIGEEMSWSRIKKRVGEYLTHYYEQMLRNQKSSSK
ncbi:MAG: hypothetical protein D6814_03210 [Calditrichaeota bacterium]|nr:MAG: hypothetical protein D6814_03210 [Calditrichota bacterium]